MSSGYTLDRRQIDIRELILNMDHNFKDVVMNITSQKSYVEVLINHHCQNRTYGDTII